ncbi:hypothetical protein P261_02872 [Lachnospiraceae bacterium TWA4]|nr:hypothetical protein P261_02872 [Lachnospiraceae bacterium TWA4]
MKIAELLSEVDGAFLFKYFAKDPFSTLKLYMTEYQSGNLIKREEISSFGYDDVKSSTNGMIVLIPNFEETSVKLIVTDGFGKYSTEIPILGNVESSSFGRSATQIMGQINLQYNSEQGLLALIYGKDGVEATPVSSIEQGVISKHNDYIYYFSFEFER